MTILLAALRAAAEPTRLRLLALCAYAELTVTELTQILGQSQPRVSRHLKLLCDAQLLERSREGTWAYYRLADDRDGSPAAQFARQIVDLIPDDDGALGRDLVQLEQIRQSRAEAAQAYFTANAAKWDQIRSLYVPETAVETRLLELAPVTIADHLDLGTGTGRILEVFAHRTTRGLGVDLSSEMLAVARAHLAKCEQYRHLSVRHANIYHLPLAEASFDLVTIHQVLHYAENPGAVIAEAARVLRPGGRVIIADFCAHAEDALRELHAHRHLGFSDEEISGWFQAVGLATQAPEYLPGEPITVALWAAQKRAAQKTGGAK